MRWLSFLVAASVFLGVFCPTKAVIGNVFKPPTVSAIEQEKPRVACDFPATHLGAKVQEVISAKGKYIERIDIARNQDTGTVRVILELSPDRDYDLRQVFFKNDNLFVLIVNDLAPARDDS